MFNNIRRKPGVYLVGMLLAIAVLIAPVALLGQYLLPPRGSALVLLGVAFPAGDLFVEFHDRRGWGGGWLRQKIFDPLRTTLQRGAFLAAGFGLAMMILAPFVARGRLSSFIENVVLDPYFSLSRHTHFVDTWLFWIGLTLTVVSLTVAYTYKYTLGPLFRWVQNGK
jgi:hypothetical protein